jgi:hypothetical protein
MKDGNKEEHKKPETKWDRAIERPILSQKKIATGFYKSRLALERVK